METFEAQKRQVVLVPFSYQGHIIPMLQVGVILQSKGFSIIVAHAETNSPNPLNHPEFFFQPLPDNLSGCDTSFHNIFAVISSLNKNCRAPLENYMVQLLKNQELHGQVTCIIYDAVMYFAAEVATQLKLPSMVLRTDMATYVQSYHCILQLHAQNCTPFPESKLQDPVPDLNPLRFKDLPIQVTSKLSKVLVDFLASFVSIRSSVAIIWNSTDYLEHSSLIQLQQHYKVPFFPIGPLHKMVASAVSSGFLEEDQSCIAWLDKQDCNSVLYVSFGSLAIIDDKELTETAWGLVNSGQPFLWVVRPSSPSGEQWVEQLPEGLKAMIGERCQIVKWAPQKEVLAHRAVGGFWSHCGWNSTMESICEGVPIICTPRFADQMINARYLTEVWKVGLQMEDVADRGAIERTIKRLMVDDEGKEIRQRTIDIREKLESSVKKGGSSYESFNDLTEFISSLSVSK